MDDDEAMRDIVANGHARYRGQLEPAECPACDGESELLGVLGYRAHYRCLYCGAEFNEQHPS